MAPAFILLRQALSELGKFSPVITFGALAAFAVPQISSADFNTHKAATLTSAQSDLQANFENPDKEAKPWTFWYWMSGNVTPEGITYDLESMAKVGIGGAYIFAIDRPGYEEYVKVEKPATANSERFWEMFQFAVKEADRLGMRIALNACDGWAVAGGPWNTPENSMQKLVSSSVIVDGGKAVNIELPRPNTTIKGTHWLLPQYSDYYQDIAVVAFPAASSWGVETKGLKGAQMIPGAAVKSGDKLGRFGTTPIAAWATDKHIGANRRVSVDQVIDLTGNMDANGRINWTPPAEGKWIIQRFGYATTGESNRPTSKIGMGLEVDKFNPEAVRFHFQNWWGKAAKLVGPELTGRVFMMNHTDSWECGLQNWSPVFRDEFIKRRGYDPIPYLPATVGIPVGSAEQSERFLWDFRRTITDLVADSFFNTSVQVTNEAGGLYSSETVSGIISDRLEYYREVDVPMAEFWVATHDQGATAMPQVTSGAHIYGKRFVQAEAFTERGIRWTEDPYFIKALGDRSFAEGINRFALHVWAHQAFPERMPGVTLFKVYGTFFSGNQPWHFLAKPWFDYLQRSQAMLQQGLPFADVAYFIGEELPSNAFRRADLSPKLPFGYDFDSINRDALLNRTRAENGRIVLPDGVTYSLLVLPDNTRMTPEVAKKIGELAMAGVAVIGPKPTASYSLRDFPHSDKMLQKIVAETWGNVKEGIEPADVLLGRGLPRDVEFIDTDMSWVHRGEKVMARHAAWNGKDDKTVHRPELETEYSSPTFTSIHRRTTDADLYFLSNQELEPRKVKVALRVVGKQPELWHAETGQMRPLTDWYVKDGRTHIPLEFEKAEAYFIVFRTPATPPAKRTPNFSSFETLVPLEGGWAVGFEKGRGAPERIELPALASLSKHSDSGVKHYSGIATYKRTFTAPKAALKPDKSERIYLDLGEVKNVAEVTLNGKTLPAVWKPPFRVDITDAVKDGENALTVRVANTWKNRLVGDAALKPEERITWSLYQDTWFKPKTQLEPSGLIGPVTFVKETLP